MTVSKKQQACIARYNAKNYEEIKLRVKKGEKATLQAIASQQGMSLNSFITTAIEQYLSSTQESADDTAQKDSEPMRAGKKNRIEEQSPHHKQKREREKKREEKRRAKHTLCPSSA